MFRNDDYHLSIDLPYSKKKCPQKSPGNACPVDPVDLQLNSGCQRLLPFFTLQLRH